MAHHWGAYSVSTMRVISFDATAQHGTAIISADDSVWIAVAPKKWDMASWFWWWLCPSDKKAMVILKNKDGSEVRTKAIRIAKKHVHISSLSKEG